MTSQTQSPPASQNAIVISDRLLTPAEVARAQALVLRLVDGLSKAILGQRPLLELAVIAILARGHMLLEGLPGLGKTELVKSFRPSWGSAFDVCSSHPTCLPGDIVGSPILEDQGGSRRLVFHKGPVFTNLLLADEINRATPKTQSALLEAMQERRVTVTGRNPRAARPVLRARHTEPDRTRRHLSAAGSSIRSVRVSSSRWKGSRAKSCKRLSCDGSMVRHRRSRCW